MSVLEDLKIAINVPLIASSKEFQDYWYLQKYLMRLKARRLLTPELLRYCDEEAKKKILHDDNEYVGIILHASLKAVVSYLHARDDRFRICVYLSKDPYLPNWEGITILVKAVYRNFREKMRLWRDLENRITKIIKQFKESKPIDFQKIDEANETIATTIDDFFKVEQNGL
jgi:hypothetical protein